MTNFREIERLRKDPQQVLSLSNALLNCGQRWSEKEVDFLEGLRDVKAPLAIRDKYYYLSTRQIEWLVDLRDGIGDYDTTPNGGFSVAILLERCWLNRFDLDNEDHIGFLEENRGRARLKKRELGLLLHIARRLHEIEEYV